MKFVLAITSRNRPEYLKQLISTWEKTKSNNEWKLIVADDGSGSKVFDYLKELSSKKRDYDLTIIECKDVGVHNLTNAIFKEIDGTGFDMCFKVDNDIYFKKTGWDLKYYEAAKETGFSHLVYNRNNQQKGVLGKMKHNIFPKMYGCFYTITQKILDTVGYFDTKNFGKAFLGHQDYSWRCCRAGFNKEGVGYDISNSLRYLEMHGKGKMEGNGYRFTHRKKIREHYKIDDIEIAKRTLVMRRKKRVYVSYVSFNNE